MEMTGGQAMAHQLAREGVTTIFGVPGVQLDWAMDGLAEVADRIAFHTTRHEQAASYLADGFARAGGGIGVCLVVPGPGLLNAMAGLATAYACSSPVLAISGQIPSHAIGRGLGMLHEVPEQSRTFGTVTKWTALAQTPADVPRVIRDALRELRSGRPRPVGVEIPPDVLQKRGDVSLVDPVAGEPVRPDEGALDIAADVLGRAKHPVIYVGGGVLDATGELRELADLLQAPVVMSPNGRGAISDRHPLALTSLGGREALPAADVVLVVGSRYLTGLGRPVTDGPQLVMLNAEVADLGPPRRPAVAVTTDARLGLAGLRARLAGLPARASRAEDCDAIRARCAKQIAEVQPQHDFVLALREAIPDDGILVNELTQVGYLAQVGFPVYHPRSYLTPGYQGTLGYGFATALGAKVAHPDRAVVSINGDGGFGWNLTELATARRYGIGLVTVVFNDGAFGNVRRTQQDRFGGRVIGTELANPDYLKLADAYGLRGARASTPAALRDEVVAGLESSEPTLIEVPVGPMPSAWHLIHDFLAKGR